MWEIILLRKITASCIYFLFDDRSEVFSTFHGLTINGVYSANTTMSILVTPHIIALKETRLLKIKKSYDLSLIKARNCIEVYIVTFTSVFRRVQKQYFCNWPIV